MSKETYKSIFDEQFKFKLNQEVRHKGDMKRGYSNDLGLLVLHRHLEEGSDDDGNVIYSRSYICRMIRFSGSGDLAKFSEKELLSIDDFNRIQLEEENKNNEMREEMHQIKKEVFDSYGVKKDDEVYILKEGSQTEFDKDTVYKVSGFEMENGFTKLLLRRIAGVGKDSAHVKVTERFHFTHVEK